MRQGWRTGEGLHDPLEMVVREERESTVGVLLQSWDETGELELKEWRKRQRSVVSLLPFLGGLYVSTKCLIELGT